MKNRGICPGPQTLKICLPRDEAVGNVDKLHRQEGLNSVPHQRATGSGYAASARFIRASDTFTEHSTTRPRSHGFQPEKRDDVWGHSFPCPKPCLRASPSGGSSAKSSSRFPKRAIYSPRSNEVGPTRGQRVSPALPHCWRIRCQPAQLPAFIGATCQGLRLSPALRTGSPRTFKPRRA
jgi:hypothetical protein